MIGQLGLGGSEKQVVMLARGLASRGVTTTVLVMFGRGEREKDLRDAGIDVVDLGFPIVHRRAELVGYARPFARLVGHLKYLQPQVLHAFLFHAYVTAAPAARLARVPVMVAGRRSLGAFKEGRHVFLAAERVATAMTDHVVANAHAVAEDARRQEGLAMRKLSVIPNGLHETSFEIVGPTPLPQGDGPLVLCVANLTDYKGHRHLLDAVAELRRRGTTCTLVLVGDGPERAALERQSDHLGLQVRFLGRRTDVPSLLAAADVVVLASLQEGASNAVMEAMAAGRPVVATAVGGTPELLQGRGVLVPPADPLALADGIEGVLADPDASRTLTRAARTWARAHLSANAMVEAHLTLYRNLLERRCAE